MKNGKKSPLLVRSLGHRAHHVIGRNIQKGFPTETTGFEWFIYGF